jgi:hypothetical protein
LFPYVELPSEGESNKKYCVPNGEFFSAVRTDYYYYKPDKNIETISDLKPVEVSRG